MTVLALITAALLLAAAYLVVGFRLAVAAYRTRLTREIEKYRDRYSSLIHHERGVDYRHCAVMADKGLIWPHAFFWPFVEGFSLAQRRVDARIGDPRDLDLVYAQQRIRDLERELGIRGTP